jgi:hypothetical protein
MKIIKGSMRIQDVDSVNLKILLEMKAILYLLLVFFLTSASSCKKNELDSTENNKISLDEKSAQLVEADNAFGLELFKQIRSLPARKKT